MSSRLLTTSNMGLRNNPAGVTHLATTPSSCSCHIEMSRVTSLSPHQQQSSSWEPGLTCWVIISVPLTQLVITGYQRNSHLCHRNKQQTLLYWKYLVNFPVCLRHRKVWKILSICLLHVHLFIQTLQNVLPNYCPDSPSRSRLASALI